MEFEKRKVETRFKAFSHKPEGILTEAQKAKMEEEKKKTEDKEKLQRESDIKGDIFVKCEWNGGGPKMPPIRSENLFKRAKQQKNRKVYS